MIQFIVIGLITGIMIGLIGIGAGVLHDTSKPKFTRPETGKLC
tara:strand:+ start:265 stop:393 length:129 start_codon:yes stop_codon:yes gene_type:complete